MANRHRGFVPIEIAGEEYVLRFDFDALADLEGRLGHGLMEGLASGGGFRFVREALIVGLNNKQNGLGAGVKAVSKLEPAKLGYYTNTIIDALRASGILGDAKSDTEDESGEAKAPTGGKARD